MGQEMGGAVSNTSQDASNTYQQWACGPDQASEQGQEGWEAAN